ncbi:MAG TPA: ATP-binding protein [Candidatus Limnocylindrales bacterium]
MRFGIFLLLAAPDRGAGQRRSLGSWRDNVDLLTILIWIAFFGVFAASIRQYARRRESLELAVVLVFSSTAAIFLISLANGLMPSLAAVLSPLAVVLLLAQPALMLRLVSLFVPLRRWALPVAIVGLVVSIGAYYATGRSVASILLLVTYFVGTEAIAATLLLREARHRVGFARARLVTAGVASLLFGLSILVAGIGSAARGGGAGGADAAVTLISRGLALLAGLGYVLAFVPPGWLRGLVHRSVAFDLVRSIVTTPAGTDPTVLWQSFAAAVAGLFGARRVRLSADGVGITHEHGSGPEGAVGPEEAAEARGTWQVDIAVRVEQRVLATVAVELTGRPLFVEDDVALVQLLGSLVARSAERDATTAILADSARAAADADAIGRTEARFRALLDAHPNAVVVVSETGSISWSTAAAARMFGIASEDIVGRQLDELVSGPPADQGLADSADGIVRYETTAHAADGTELPVEVAMTELGIDAEGSRLVVIADNTWRKQANAVRDHFIDVLSHELRTPVTAIFGGAQVLLRRQELAPETRRELIADVAAEAERLQHMVENLLVLARIEAAAEISMEGPLLVHRTVADLVERERATYPGLRLTSEIPAYVPVVVGDEASIALVVKNLISNAAKYAGDGACVQVKVAADDGGVTVSVADNGPGFDPRDADNLFRLYFRSRATNTAAGSGVGLFVADQLVRALGGRMFASVRPEGGSVFGFTLPVYDTDEQGEEGARHADPAHVTTAAADAGSASPPFGRSAALT